MKHIQENSAYQLSGLISAKFGLNFPKERFRDLENGLNKAKKDFGFDDLVQFVDWLLGIELTSAQIEQLASHFTIGETYFFRDIKYFNAIEKILKEELIPQKSNLDKRLRIWSAGCSTGEEPYSIAIMANRILADLKDWNITIVGTDINTKSLKKAQGGIYKEWSFRNPPDWLKADYFTESSKGSYQINQSIKDMLTFQYHNLAIDPYPSLINNLFAFDIIFCRNVMMYFTQDLMSIVIEKFYHSLNDSGLLIVSPSEASHILFGAYETLYYPDVILYKKIRTDYIPEKLHQIDKENYFHLDKEIADYDLFPVQKKSKKVNNAPKKIPQEIEKKVYKRIDISFSQTAEPMENAMNLFKSGHYDEAEKLLKSILSSDKKNTGAMSLLSNIYGNRGLTEEANTWSQKAIDADKLNPEPYYLQAMLLQETGKTEEAAARLKKVLYLDSKSVLAHFGLGNLLFKQGKISESNRHFKNVSKLLCDYDDNEIIGESDGITAGRFKEIINKIIEKNYERVH
ncbi:MAG: hypothetical protein A2X61_11040 [Ignavibacteria bacterium GWB2_35_12]|nr:MAG: hypothetical protein A2X61_11040 [Ignavibacteria bacterium GWB2_35_12]OGU87662.1 MAG: hypothetical protein A2220_12695 [Ignavibacteria bacterium RIFOXYA2_FULL_35_10]OGV24793.1 MAG: hypothetical protein A2475_14265 [Ignavibacteria bacterium RIFOXYC2_FULL_35_21]